MTFILFRFVRRRELQPDQPHISMVRLNKKAHVYKSANHSGYESRPGSIPYPSINPLQH